MTIVRIARKILPESVKVRLRRLRHRYRQRGFDPYVSAQDVGGARFQFVIGDSVGKEWYDSRPKGEISHEMAFVRDELVALGDIVLDCGAHHGFRAILFALWAGREGRVVAFEPMPANFALLERSVRLNGLENVECVRKAVGRAPGRLRFIEESNSRATPLADNGVEVEVTHLDAYASMAPDLVKIDVEGFEVELLKGAEAVLGLRPKLVIEVHAETLANFGTNVDELVSLLDREGYEWWIQRNANELPIPYRFESPILERAHLFGRPKLRT